MNKPVEAKMASGFGYQLTTLDNTIVALVPRVYDGRIFIVNTEIGDIAEKYILIKSLINDKIHCSYYLLKIP